MKQDETGGTATEEQAADTTPTTTAGQPIGSNQADGHAVDAIEPSDDATGTTDVD